MVMFLISSSWGSVGVGVPVSKRLGAAAGCDVFGSDFPPAMSCEDTEAGCILVGSRFGDSVGDGWPETFAEVAFEGVREGTRDETVRLSRVKRSEVMITCGTWYV